MATQEEALKQINEISRRHQMAERYTCNISIRYDIQRMRSRYYELHGKLSNRILLNAEAEGRFTAFIICHYISQDNDEQVYDILDVGVRKMGMKMYGMEIFFDCPEFCVEG